MKRIKQSKLWELMEIKTSTGQPRPFSLTFIKKTTGEIVHYPKCTCSSIHSKGSTVNVVPEGASRPKTIRKCLIIEFNSSSIYL